jgi:hypothetical protein
MPRLEERERVLIPGRVCTKIFLAACGGRRLPPDFLELATSPILGPTYSRQARTVVHLPARETWKVLVQEPVVFGPVSNSVSRVKFKC